MIAVKKTGNGAYEVTFQKPVQIIDKHSGYMLKKEVGKLISAHRKITIDFKQLNSISDQGVKLLEQLAETAENKRCKIVFRNYGPEIGKKIHIQV